VKIDGDPRDAKVRSLSDAIRSGDVDQVKVLVGEVDAAATIQGQYRRFGPLHEAVISPNACDIIAVLASAALDINCYDSSGQTPLQWALETGAGEPVIEALIANGANVHVRDNEEKTLLFSAAQAGRLEFCCALINAGVDVHAVEKAGWTALHMAALNRHISICRLLVEAGASSSFQPEFPADDYLTPFQTAVRFSAVNTAVYFIVECGESLDQSMVDGRVLRDAVASSVNGRSVLTAIDIESGIALSLQPETSAPADVVPAGAKGAAGPL
jgi:ankyrin repeat protein